MKAGVYKRRKPEHSTLYKIVFNNYETYESIYEEKYEPEYGYLRTEIKESIKKYLDCGIMEHGMARIYCKKCGKDYFVAFSCKTRFFCPSCSQKRTLIWSDWVMENVVKNVPHRQWVFTIPKILRKLFYKDRTLLGGMADCARDTLKELFGCIYEDENNMPGIILSTQTFGNLLVWHPHIHCLVTDGVFDKDTKFHPIPTIDKNKALFIFREKIFAMLKDNSRISDKLIKTMRNWNHSGFSVDNSVKIEKDDYDSMLRLAQYIVHSSFSQKKIKYIESSGSIIYKSKMHLGKKRNFEVLDAIEFLHRVCLHIPGPYEALIRYYGYYSNAARGKRKKSGLELDILDGKFGDVDVIDDAPSKRACRKSWAQLIYKVYEVDPLLCPNCESQMKFIAFIQSHIEIKKILKHIKLWPIEYPENSVNARASPNNYTLNLDLLSKQVNSRHINL